MFTGTTQLLLTRSHHGLTINLPGSDGVASWTTRFGISGPDGKLAKEDNSTQANGDKIPWGVGKLLSSDAAVPVSSSSSSVVPVSSAAPVASDSPAVSSASSSSAPAPAAEPVTEKSSASTSPVAQIAAKGAENAGAMIKPTLGFVSAAVVGYFAL